MAKTLYLVPSRARYLYQCVECKSIIRPRTSYFRHEPYPYGRMYRGEQVLHFCTSCVESSDPQLDTITGNYRVPAVRIFKSSGTGSREALLPLQAEIFGIGRVLAERLARDSALVHELTPDEFEEFICDRLFAMGFEPKRTGNINSRDGGIDVIFWPRVPSAFPVLGAAQVKHHRSKYIKEGAGVIRDFAGAIASHPFNAGLIVTNTSFTPDAEWFARERAKLIRLRDIEDIRRWLVNNFSDDQEWREMPTSLELCPGVIIKVR